MAEAAPALAGQALARADAALALRAADPAEAAGELEREFAALTGRAHA